MGKTKMTAVDAALDAAREGDEAGALAGVVADDDWMRSEDLDDKYAVIESSGAVWYVHEDGNGNADCRRCATWDEAMALVPAEVAS